jgi:hypothetical protein
MARFASARPLFGVALTLTLGGCAGAAAAPSAAAPTPAPTIAAAAPTPAATAAATRKPATPSPTPNPLAGPTTFDATTIDGFDVPVTIQVPAGWIVLTPPQYTAPRSFNLVEGEFSDDSTWWGPGFAAVDGASVVDPAFLDQKASAGDPKLPWPASFIDYATGLPGVTVVDGPSPITIGGVEGRQIVLKTPVLHPLVYLKDDFAWVGGGRSGIDPALVRWEVELTVGGHPLWIEHLELDQAHMDKDLPQVKALVDGISFKR